MKWQRPATYSLLAVVALAMAVFAFNIQVCRDWALICENTGSRKGYRRWTLGPETGHWYEKSPLEEFVAAHDPNALTHRWTSYAGTGKNVFGTPVLFGHGRPGAIRRFDHEIQSLWIAHNTPEDVRKLYDLLVSDDQDAIRKRITDIREQALKYGDRIQPADVQRFLAAVKAEDFGAASAIGNEIFPPGAVFRTHGDLLSDYLETSAGKDGVAVYCFMSRFNPLGGGRVVQLEIDTESNTVIYCSGLDVGMLAPQTAEPGAPAEADKPRR